MNLELYGKKFNPMFQKGQGGSGNSMGGKLQNQKYLIEQT